MCTRGVIECQVLAAGGSLVRTYNAPDACGSAHAWPISIALLSDQSTIADVVAMPSTSDLRIFLRLIAPHPMRSAVSAPSSCVGQSTPARAPLPLRRCEIRRWHGRHRYTREVPAKQRDWGGLAVTETGCSC